MRLALEQARAAASCGEVPVGAIIVSAEGEIIASSHNQPISLHDPTAHAEINAIRKACIKNRNYRLTGATLYVTIEPCCMCAGAMVHARIARLVFGAWDKRSGACGSIHDLVRDERLNHRVEVIPGVLEHDCSKVIQDFFSTRRNGKQNLKQVRPGWPV